MDVNPTNEQIDAAVASLNAYTTTALGTTGPDGPHVAGVFMAAERDGSGIRLVMALLRDSRKHREAIDDPRVAFMCSPGDPSTWIQGYGAIELVEDTARYSDLYERLVAHAPGARPFVESLPVLPAIVHIRGLKVVEDPTKPGLELEFGAAAKAA